MEFTIEKAKPKDAQNVRKLWLQLLKVYPNSFRTTFTEAKKTTVLTQKELISKTNLQKNSIMLLAETKKEIIGMITCLGGNLIKTKHIGTIVGFGVLPEFTKSGVGTALMNKLVNWAKKESLIERLEVSLYSDNYKVLKLYKKLGFVQEGLQKKASKGKNKNYQDIINLSLFLPKNE